MRWIKIPAALAVIFWVASCASMQNSVTQVTLKSGDYIITQESPEARQRQQDKSAESYIFHLARGGSIQRMAQPPAIVAPRGIRAIDSERFVFADSLDSAIKVISPQGSVTTLYSGSPLTAPKDVAIDRDGGYVIADFESFTTSSPASILKLSRDGKITPVYQGRPLQWPHGIDVDRNGNYIVADASGTLFRVHPQGAITPVFTGRPLINATDVKVDAQGNYIVTDIGVVIDGATGLAVPSKSRNPGKLLKITPDGRVSPITVQPRARFRAVALHPDGSYIVVDMQNAIYRVTPEGTTTVLHQGRPLHQPAGIAIVP